MISHLKINKSIGITKKQAKYVKLLRVQNLKLNLLLEVLVIQKSQYLVYNNIHNCFNTQARQFKHSFRNNKLVFHIQ